jgi:hypothetical protein
MRPRVTECIYTKSKSREIKRIPEGRLRPPDNQEQSHSKAKLSDKFQLRFWVYLFYCTDCFVCILIVSYIYTEIPFKKRVLRLIDLEINPI